MHILTSSLLSIHTPHWHQRETDVQSIAYTHPHPTYPNNNSPINQINNHTHTITPHHTHHTHITITPMTPHSHITLTSHSHITLTPHWHQREIHTQHEYTHGTSQSSRSYTHHTHHLTQTHIFHIISPIHTSCTFSLHLFYPYTHHIDIKERPTSNLSHTPIHIQPTQTIIHQSIK